MRKPCTFGLLLLNLGLLACAGLLAGGSGVAAIAATHIPYALNGPDARYIENRGQWPDEARFLIQSPNLDMWLADAGIVYDLYTVQSAALRKPVAGQVSGQGISRRRGHVVRLEFLHAAPGGQWDRKDRSAGNYNYFIGRDSSRWARNVGRFAETVQRNVYPGVDVRYYCSQAGPRYDFVLRPGADPRQILFRVHGADGLSVEGDALHIQTGMGNIVNDGLLAYQEIHGQRVEIPCAFRIIAPGTVSFELGDYDAGQTLIIDPLVFATFLGGTQGENGFGITRDSEKNIYVVGATGSVNFPTTTGAYDQEKSNITDVFISKLNFAGSELIYSTFVGGHESDIAYDIAVDNSGNAYVTGVTFSGDFPVRSALDPDLSGDRDVFVLKLAHGGNTLNYSGYLGGSGWDEGYGIALHGGNAFVTGTTTSNDFPVTPGAYSEQFSGQFDAFVAKIASAGNVLVYSSYFGGADIDQANDIAVDQSAQAVVAGETRSAGFPTQTGSYDRFHNGEKDAFVFKLNAAGSNLLYGTFLGGTNEDGATCVTLDGQNSAYVGGFTRSTDFPVTANVLDATHNGSVDGFLSKVSSSGNILMYSTYIGGSYRDQVAAVAVDNTHRAYITGFTESNEFPTTPGAFDESQNGNPDSFVSKLNTVASDLLYSTFLGGNSYNAGEGIVVDAEGNAFVVGSTESGNFPATGAAYDKSYNGNSDAFVAEIGTESPQLQLDTPNGGETWCVGTTRNITWSSRSIRTIKILLSSDGGNSYNQVLSNNAPAAPGVWKWALPDDLEPGSTYRIRIIDADHDAVRDNSNANFIVSTPPEISEHPADAAVCVGLKAVFSAAAEALPAPEVQWQYSTDGGANWHNIPGADAIPLEVAGIRADMDGTLYRALFTNECSPAGIPTRPARLGTLLSPVIERHPQNRNACLGESVRFTVRADQENVQFQWRRNGKDIPGATDSVLLIEEVAIFDAGNYDVVVTGQCPPAKISNKAGLTVQDVPAISLYKGFRRAACPGETVDTIVRIHNTGPMNLKLRLEEISNPRFAMLEPINTIGAEFTLNAGQELNLRVRFTPDRAGTEVGELRFRTEPCNLDFRVGLGASADSVNLAAAGKHEFEELYQCDSLRREEISIRNTGDTELNVTGISFSDPQFSLAEPEKLPYAVPAGESRRVLIEFRSNGNFGRQSALAVFETDLCGFRRSMQLEARRERIDFAPLSSRLDFGTLVDCQSDTTLSFALRNGGNSTIRIDSLLSTNSAFGAIAPAPPFNLRPGEVRTVQVRFSGRGEGPEQGLLRIISGRCGVERTLEMSGEKLQAAIVTDIVALGFGEILLCDIKPDSSFSIRNTGGQPVTITAVEADAAFQVLQPGALPHTIAPDGELLVHIRFASAAEGSYSGTLKLAYETAECRDTLNIGLNGKMLLPELRAEPAEIDALRLSACQTVGDTTLVIVNNSATPMLIGGYAAPEGFRVLNPLPFGLAPGASVELRLRFDPQGQSSVSGLLQLRAEPCDYELAIPVHGRKEGVSFTVSQERIDFGVLPWCPGGEVHVPAALLLGMVNDDPEGESGSLSAVQFASGTAFSSPDLKAGAELENGIPQEFSIVFSAAAAGSYSDTLALTFLPCGTRRSVQLRAELVPQILTTTPAALLDFGMVASGSGKNRTVVYRNHGQLPLNIENFAINGAAFTLVPPVPALPYELPPGDSLVLLVRYTSSSGEHSGALQLEVAAPCAEQYRVELRGRGTDVPLTELSAEPLLLDFGQVRRGTQKTLNLNLRNSGGERAEIFEWNISGSHAPRFGMLSLMPATVASGESHTLQFTFSPNAPGLCEALWTVEYNGKPLEVLLRGEGMEAPGRMLHVRMPVLTAPPGERLSIPILMQRGEGFPPGADTRLSYRLEIAYRADLFYTYRAEGASLVASPIEQGQRVLLIEGTLPAGDTLCMLYGETLIPADSLATPLTFRSMEWNAEDINTGFTDGRLTLETDLIIKKGDFYGFRSVQPNPSFAAVEFRIETVEAGQHYIRFYDQNGRLAMERRWEARAGNGGYAALHTVVLETATLVSGVYTIVLQSPGGRMAQTRIVVFD